MLAGVALVAANLRPAAASMGPVLGRIEKDVGLHSAAAGALVTLPVLCFGLLGPLGPVLARRFGLRRAIAVAMWLLLAGLGLRLVPGLPLLFLGTALAGAAISIGNVLVPVLIRRDLSARPGLAMAVYSTVLIGFAALAAGVTVPVANALGGGWRPGLAVWVIPAAAAALLWLPALRRADPVSTSTAGEPRASVLRELLRHPLAWQITFFFAVQSGGFYSTLAWLPSIFRSHGASDGQAGLLLSLTMVVGVLTALVVPGLAARLRDQRLLATGCCLLAGLGWLGIALAPMSAPALWAVLLGLGQNAVFPLALMLFVLRSGSVRVTEGLSTLAQSVGYALAAAAPVAVGALHSLAHSWTPAVLLLLGLLVPQLVLGLAAGRARRIPG